MMANNFSALMAGWIMALLFALVERMLMLGTDYNEMPLGIIFFLVVSCCLVVFLINKNTLLGKAKEFQLLGNGFFSNLIKDRYESNDPRLNEWREKDYQDLVEIMYCFPNDDYSGAHIIIKDVYGVFYGKKYHQQKLPSWTELRWKAKSNQIHFKKVTFDASRMTVEMENFEPEH